MGRSPERDGPGETIEWAAASPPARREIRHVLFDFDGTISTIRHGWAEVMASMFCEAIPRAEGELEDDARRLALDDILSLNGRPTIDQMARLADRVRGRGGSPLEPMAYRAEYLRRLDARIARRMDGPAGPDAFLVHGVRAVLDHLRGVGLGLTLASGTDEAAVRREADWLGVAGYFGGGIHGARDSDPAFSKRRVIDRILAEHGFEGRHLLAFGDGHVEIEEIKAVGGFAVAVASDEENIGSGRVDPRKRERLLGVGADAVIPDYRDAIGLVDALLGRKPA